MERRLVVAILLMIAVAMVPSLFFKPPRRPTPSPGDSARASAVPAETATARPAPGPTPGPTPPGIRRAPRAAAPAISAETLSVATSGARYTLTTLGAALEGAEFTGYRSYAGATKGRPAQLLRPGDRMLAERLVVGRDTIALDSLAFAVERSSGGATFRGRAGELDVQLSVAPRAGAAYLLDVSGEVGGLGGRGALLLVALGSGFANVEADSVGNYRAYAVVGHRTEPVSISFSKLKPAETQTLDGPFDWVAVKSKYFIGALLSPDSTQPAFGGAVATGGVRTSRSEVSAETWATLPVGAGRAVPLRPLPRATGIPSVAEPGPRAGQGLPVRLDLQAHRDAGLGMDHPAAAVDAPAAVARLRVGADPVRPGDTAGAVAAEPEGDDELGGHAGHSAAHEGHPGAAQGRPAAVAAGDDEAVQRAQGEPVRRLPADAAAVPDPPGAVLRLRQHDRVPRARRSCGCPICRSGIRPTSSRS